MNRHFAAALLVASAAASASASSACTPFSSDQQTSGGASASGDASADADASVTPTFHGQSTAEDALGYDLKLPRPPKTTPGDVVFAVVFAQNVAFVLPAGWTSIDQQAPPCGGAGTAQWVFHLAVDNDPLEWVFRGGTPPGKSGVAGIAAAYGGLALSPPEVHNASTGGTGPYRLPSITLPTAGSLLIASVALGQNATNWTDPEGLVQRAEVSNLALFDGVRATAGATPDTSISSSETNSCYATVLVAFGPR